MVRQYRIERLQGLEILVCEVYDRYCWSASDNEAFERWRSGNDRMENPREVFRHLLEEWLNEEHSPEDTFFGIREPIPSLEWIPSVVIRSAIVNNRPVQLQVDFKSSVVNIVVEDEIHRFFEFLKSPHWRNTIQHQISAYGSLFASIDD